MAEVGIVIGAEDKATRVLKKVGDEAEKSFRKIDKGAKQAKAGASELDKELGKTFERFTATAAAGVAFAAAATAVYTVFDNLSKSLVETLPKFNEFNTELSETDTRLASIGMTLADEEFQNLNLVSKALVLGFQAVNNELAKNEAALQAIVLEAKNRQRQQDAVNSLIDDESDAVGVAVDMSSKLKLIKDRVAESDKKRADIARAAHSEQQRYIAEEQAAWIEHYALLEEYRNQQLEASSQRIDLLVEKRARARDMQLELDESIAREQDRIFEDQAAKRIAVNEQMVTSIGAGFASMVDGSKSAGKAITGMILDVAEKAIISNALSAGAGAGSAVAQTPIIGPALVPGAIAAVFGIVRALLSQLPGYEFGGVVTGGTPNRDSVPALLTPGERVLTQRERKEYEEQSARRGETPININFNPQIGFIGVPSGVERRRVAIELGKALEEEVRSGNVGLALAVAR